MDNKSTYKTRQRETILEFLRCSSGSHVTVNDVCVHCKDNGIIIGQTTVYRQLEKMVDEGIVNKYIIDVGSPACFEYIGDAERPENGPCFHCKCEKCGKLIHLHCSDLMAIQKHLLDEHQFMLNPRRTVFYGICEDCRRTAGTK